MRARMILVAALVATLGLGACGTTSTPASTKVLLFGPFSGTSGATAPAVEATEPGSCWEGSLAVFQDATAWRCTAGNQIMDPCFGPPDQPNATQVVCVSSPWSTATRLVLTQPLPEDEANAPGNGAKAVWAFALTNRDHCLVGTGTVPEAGSVVLEYTCASGAAAGQLDQRHEPWTVEYRQARSQSLRSVPVLTAWDA